MPALHIDRAPAIVTAPMNSGTERPLPGKSCCGISVSFCVLLPPRRKKQSLLCHHIIYPQARQHKRWSPGRATSVDLIIIKYFAASHEGFCQVLFCVIDGKLFSAAGSRAGFFSCSPFSAAKWQRQKSRRSRVSEWRFFRALCEKTLLVS